MGSRLGIRYRRRAGGLLRVLRGSRHRSYILASGRASLRDVHCNEGGTRVKEDEWEIPE